MQGNKEHPKSAANYKYVTALRQKDEIVNAQLAIEPCDRDTLYESIAQRVTLA